MRHNQGSKGGWSVAGTSPPYHDFTFLNLTIQTTSLQPPDLLTETLQNLGPGQPIFKTNIDAGKVCFRADIGSETAVTVYNSLIQWHLGMPASFDQCFFPYVPVQGVKVSRQFLFYFYYSIKYMNVIEEGINRVDTWTGLTLAPYS
jgi:hypothetical protein